jgi:hypothetical protein
MHRRDLMKSFMALPAVAEIDGMKEISATSFRPGDIVVFKCDEWLTDAAKERIVAQWMGIVSDLPFSPKIVVLDGGADLRVLRREEE